jgi:Glyoxalase-like domain
VLIDHIIYAHPDLDVAVAEIKRRFGVLATGGGKHPGRGTHNKLLALGARTYLEIIAPDPNQPEPSEPRPYGVEGITHGALVGWAIAAHDIEASLTHARSQGFDPGWVLDGHRVDSTGTLLRWRLTQNALAAGLIPFLINWGDTQHPALSAPAGLVLRSVRLEHPEPPSLMKALAAMGADVEVIRAPKAALVARIDGPYGERELR